MCELSQVVELVLKNFVRYTTRHTEVSLNPKLLRMSYDLLFKKYAMTLGQYLAMKSAYPTLIIVSR